ncbi:MAG: gluconate 2-dehydrogenase subunit 3 family protein [Chitinophagaceae bacterium]
MRNDFYPEGTVRALLNTGLITPATHDVLTGRLANQEVLTPIFFSKENFVTLTTVCKRLIPQLSAGRQVDLPGIMDRQLASGTGNGWRYASMPADGQAMLKGLYGIDETATIMFGKAYRFLDSELQDEVLHAIQSGVVLGVTWQSLPARLFFEELLAILAELYYSHPLAKEEIGEVSMADAKGWSKIGLNELEDHEPRSIKT